MHNEELYNLYCSPIFIFLVKPKRNNKICGERSMQGEKGICMKEFGGKTLWKEITWEI
jgi:hypothetical protein